MLLKQKNTRERGVTWAKGWREGGLQGGGVCGESPWVP